MADLAAIYAGGFPAGIYTTNTPDQCQYIADHSDSAVVVVEDQAQLAKFLAVSDRLPKVKAFVVMQGKPQAEGRLHLRPGARARPGRTRSGSRSAHRCAEARRRVHAHLHLGHDR
ncbi:MAG: AMP-binding protein [Myxococcales bacterium]|nr:AMP-binding protein [Myxococcales bacterium]